MDRTSLSHNRINYKRTAPDFSGSGISSLNTLDVGQTGTRAVRDEAWNELEEHLNYNIQNYDNSLQEEPSQLEDTDGKLPGVGSTYDFAANLSKAVIGLFDGDYKGKNDQSTSYFDQAVNINVRDALSINIQARVNELRETEGKWLPEIQTAKRYLEQKALLSELSIDGPDYFRVMSEVQELESQVKEAAKTNPYIRDIFYGEAVEPAFTHPGQLYPRAVSRDVMNSVLQNNRNQYLIDLSWNQTNNELNDKLTANAKLSSKLDRLNKNLEDANVALFEKESDIKAKQKALKTKHMLHDPLLGIVPLGITYDPDEIDPAFDQKRNEVEISLFDPSTYKYGLTHLGSSVSELQAMGATMATAKLIQWGGRASKHPGIWALTETGVNLLSTSYFRHKETAAEVLSSYTEKLLENSDKFDINKVMKDYEFGLEARGYDVSSMDDLEKLQFGLAYNIQTEDANYNTFAKNARVGLTEIEQGNNALALSDYLQNFGLSYTGKIVNEAIGAKAIAKGIGNAVMKNDRTRKLLESVKSRTGKIADKVFDNPMQKVATKRALESIANFTINTGKRAISEGIEEGQQGVFQRRYMDRPVDDTQTEAPYSFLNGVIQSGTAAVEATLAYNGLHWNDMYNTDDQLRKAMSVGSFIGALMGASPDVYQLNRTRKQIESDLSIQELSARGLDRVDRSFKVAQFLDSYRNGNRPDYLRSSIEALKDYKGTGVTDKMIDEDIETSNLVYGVYKNKQITDNLKELGINRKSGKDFEMFVQNHVELVNSFDEANQLADAADSKVTEKIGQLFNETLDSPLNQFIQRQYNTYTSGLDSEQTPVSLSEFRAPIVNALVTRATSRVLDRLNKDLNQRKKTLEEIKNEYGVDVSTQGIVGLQEFIKKQQKDAKDALKRVDNTLFKGTMNTLEDPANIEELEDLLAVSILNSGISNIISTKLNTYNTGRLPISNRYLVDRKPLWNTLDDAEKNSVLTEYSEKYKQEHQTQEEPTRRQLISYYNYKVNQSWKDIEDSANVEANERTLANAMFREDLRNTRKSLQQAQLENQEELDTPIVDQEITSEQTTTKTAVEPDEDKGSDTKQTSQEASHTVDTVSDDVDRNSTNTPVDDIATNSSDTQVDEVTDNTGDTTEVKDIDAMLDDVADESYVEDNDVTEVTTGSSNEEERATIDRVDDNTLEIDELKAKYDKIEDGEPIADIGSAEDADVNTSTVDSDTQSEETVEEPKPDRPTSPRQTNPTVTLTPESFDGSTDETAEVPLETQDDIIYTDGTDTWVGNEDPSLGSPVSDEEIEMQGRFEQVDAVDMATTQEAANYLGQTDKSPGLDTKKKVETNRIHSTFFYAFDSSEIMPIEANGKPMQFDGERRPGVELADKLSIPGWLSKQKAYYIVTDNKETRKTERDAADRMAVHLIIEETTENGEKLIYNLALYQPDKARAKMRKWNVSSSKTNTEINKLRQLRKSIIDKYVKTYASDYFTNVSTTLPQIAPKGIVPVNLRQSNGSINSQQSEGKRPVYRSLTEVEEFGLSSDPLEMSRQILNGEVEFGYGKGPFPMDPEDRFTIVNFDQVTKASAQGVGYAGKIYIVPKVGNTPSQRVSVPIMLAEKRHFIEGGSKNLVTSYTPKGVAKYDDNGKRIPLSTAELLFRLVTQSLPISNNPEFLDLLDILVNYGPGTVAVGDNRVEKLSFYIRKTLYYYTNTKGSYLMYANRTPEGAYITKYLKIKDTNGRIVFTEQQAYDVIRQISNNLHWNTDKEAMMQPISDNIVNAAIEYMDRYNTDYYRVANCDELTFTMQDLNLVRGADGKVVRNGDTPILMSWMINHQILKTDVGDHAFKDPFVYADDAAVAETAEVRKPENKLNAKQTTERKHTDQPKNSKFDIEQYEPTEYPKDIATEEARVQKSKLLHKEEIQDVHNQSGNIEITIKSNDPSIKYYIIKYSHSLKKWRLTVYTDLNVDPQEHVNNSLSEEARQKVIDRYVPKDLQEYYTSGQEYLDHLDLLKYQDELEKQGKTLKERIKLLFSTNIGNDAALRDRWGIYTFNPYTGETNYIRESEVAVQPPKQDIPLTYDETIAAGLTPKQGWTYVRKADGNYVMVPNNSRVLQKLLGNRGVFSTQRGEGDLDITAAKKWLHDTLGIEPDDVMVTNAAMKAINNPQAYGLLQSVFDRIHNEFTARITLSTKGGAGVEYHEAWHYVSLLLLSPAQRDQIYSDYVKRNPEYANSTKQEVEEQLAEEFRTYMLNETNPTWTYRIKKFFKAVWKLVSSFAGKEFSLQNQVFAAIRKGNFKNAQLDQETLEEFNKKYDVGIGYYAPGISDAEQEKMPHIANANTLYNIVETLSNTALSILNIRSMEDIQNLKLDDVFDNIQYLYEIGEYDYNESKKQMVSDVLSNKELFAKQIRAYLQELGIRAIEREEAEIAEKEAKDSGDTYDNVWDRASYEISKKANVAFNAKLFFYSIPQSRFATDENGNQIVDTVKDNIFGLDVAQSFDITWNRILDNLWQSNDWPDLVNRVRNLAKADPFFATLLNRIDNPAFQLPENTVTQLLTTIQSAKNSMDTVDIFDTSTGTIQKNTKGRGSKVWTVMDSSNLRKIARLPSQWSQNFMLSSLIITDKNNRSRIDTVQYSKLSKLDKDILNDLTSIQKQLNNKNPEIRNQGLKQFEQTKGKLLSLLNSIGIPFDMESLNYLLKKVNTNSTSYPEFFVFSALYKNMPGSISNSVLHNIRLMNNSKSLEAKIKKQTVSASRIFNYKSPNAVINLMAIAYGEIHPTPEEFSVTGADGSLLYPITQNNYMSDQLRWLNTDAYNKLSNIAKSAYSANSLIVKALTSPDKPKLKLHTLIAIKDNISNSSRDYFGITPLEDYIAKLLLIHQGRLILPTMSDKKTWYSIEGVKVPKDFLGTLKYALNDQGSMEATIIERRFSNETLDIFCNYFLDEYNAIVKYFDTKSDVEKGKSRFYDNYHGKIGKDGKMAPGGNGGRFRYFNQLPINGVIISLNRMLDEAEKSGNPELVNEALKRIKTDLIQDRELLRSTMNSLLLDKVNKEIEQAIKLGVISRDRKGNLQYGNLPSTSVLEDQENSNPFAFYEALVSHIPEEYNAIKQNDIIYSIIANYVTGYAISIEEVEKCFVGDPAFYKWKSDKVVGIFQRDVDKIKRLSSVLSTGTNLRTHWGDNDPRNSTKYTSAILQDNMIGSEYHSRLEQIFKADLARTMLKKNNPSLTDDELFKLTSDKRLDDTLKDRTKLSVEDVKFIEKQAVKSADPYAYDDENNSGNINQADAAVYIRPAFYKRVMQALGEWSPEIEEAYNILEGDADVLGNPDLYAKALKASIKPLKMMYFGDHFDEISGINVPVFDKMALFPMFKVLAKADNKYLYDRMNNEQLGTIDMLKFESSTKVGSTRDKLKVYKDNKNTQLNKEAINSPSTTVVDQDTVVERLNNGLTTRVQDIKQLRLQLNTEPHEHTDRSFGTQAVKICIGNVVDDRHYGHNKGQNVSGAKIKKDVFGCIKALSTKGYIKLKGGNGKAGRFFDKNGRINNRALSEYLIQEARGTNMSAEVTEALALDKNGNFRAPIASLSTRNWIESKIISLINKEVIDVNTPGGSAIQMASFGFRSNEVWSEEKARPFNDGKKLSFDPDKGSMEVMLSTNFFRDVVPQEYQKDYVTMRNWLVEHKVIGGESKPYGIGYRIPTQGLSSTFSFIVADVLPAQTGDTIVVPDEFTAMTGSDFDIDKLYIATYAYDPETNERYTWNNNAKSYVEQTEGALINKLLDSYTLVISDKKTLAETRASIDTLTGILKKEILPLVQTTELKEAEPMYELMPSFQESRKTEYTSGKAGIAPFALNSTNHCLTQATHLRMKFSEGASKYNLNQFDEITGQDGYKILDWLSAMINAHVDVAKDPYIIVLNVNKVTYNMASFLLRTGKGRNTFLFLAQPALKEYADRKIMNEGVIGVSKQYDNQIFSDIKQKYWDMLNKFPISDAHRKQIEDLVQKGSIEAFNQSKLASSLDAFRSGDVTPTNIVQQLLVIKAYQDLMSDAQTMADLVQRSQIDTKKYGNNLSQLQNFYNSYTTFIEDNKDKFYTDKQDTNGLDLYFGNTFLHKKLIYAMDLSNSILRSQVFAATNGYKEILTSILQQIRGGEYVPTNNGKSMLFKYKATSNKEYVGALSNKVESIIRAKVIANNTELMLTDEEISDMLFGSESIARKLNNIKNYIRTNKDDINLMSFVDEQGNITNTLLNYLQAVTSNNKKNISYINTSTSTMNNSRYYEDRLRSAFYDLLTSEDNIVREFAETLVKYSFLTSYDNRTPNSFFNLVPMWYKRKLGYVSSIADAINKLNYGDTTVINSNNSSDQIDQIYLNLVRNYWRDNDIVPVFVRRVRRNDDGGESVSNVINLASATNKSRVNVNTVISIKGDYDLSRNHKFFKIVGLGNNIDVYQRIGDIVNLDTGKTIERIYTVVPKLGFDAGSNSIYELYKDGNQPSAFDTNNFTDKMLDQVNGAYELADKRAKLLNGKDSVVFVKDGSYHSVDYSNYDSIEHNASIELDQADNYTEQSIQDSSTQETEIQAQETITPEEFVDSTTDPSEIDNINHIDDTLLSDLDGMESDSGIEFEDLTPEPEAVDVTELITEIIDSVETPIDDITQIDEGTISNLKKNGKKRKKECK